MKDKIENLKSNIMSIYKRRCINNVRVIRLIMWFSIFGLFISLTDGLSSIKSQPVGGFSFDCDNTPSSPCRTLVANYKEQKITIEPSSITWSNRYNKAIVVSDNYNDLIVDNAGHYVIVSFSLKADSSTIAVEPLLTPQQAADYPLYDLEGVTLIEDRLYAIGSLALHGKNPDRDRWERHQFVQMDLTESNGVVQANNLTHVSQRWPDFRNWLISKSGYPWTGEETRGRAEADGINVEALSANSLGNLVLGFRGPLLPDGSVLALELSPPAASNLETILVKKHAVPQVEAANIPQGAPKTLRGMVEIPEQPGEYYVLLGPKGYEKELVVLARWNSNTGTLTKATPLPEGIVAEGVVPIAKNKLLIIDDLKEAILVATEN